MKQIPTLKESGIDFSLNVWTGIGAPKEIPAELQEKLSAALEKMILDPEFQETIEKLGMKVDYLNSRDSKKKWEQELDTFSKLIRGTGLDKQIQERKK